MLGVGIAVGVGAGGTGVGVGGTGVGVGGTGVGVAVGVGVGVGVGDGVAVAVATGVANGVGVATTVEVETAVPCFVGDPTIAIDVGTEVGVNLLLPPFWDARIAIALKPRIINIAATTINGQAGFDPPLDERRLGGLPTPPLPARIWRRPAGRETAYMMCVASSADGL